MDFLSTNPKQRRTGVTYGGGMGHYRGARMFCNVYFECGRVLVLCLCKASQCHCGSTRLVNFIVAVQS